VAPRNTLIVCHPTRERYIESKPTLPFHPRVVAKLITYVNSEQKISHRLVSPRKNSTNQRDLKAIKGAKISSSKITYAILTVLTFVSKPDRQNVGSSQRIFRSRKIRMEIFYVFTTSMFPQKPRTPEAAFTLKKLSLELHRTLRHFR